jgi:RNA polymerase sigma-70 factor (ECF subfamily)
MQRGTQGGIMTPLVAESFEQHRRLLWGLCYRMTGSAADADDLVQETFARALSHPPSGEVRPWLSAIAANLARDHLRRRRRLAYDGPWLPQPLELLADDAPTPAARYGTMESVTFAFLLALEALTPQQRAVLLLRDVFDYSVDETARSLGLSGGAIKTTHHRARKAMAAYDHNRSIPTPALAERTRAALERFLGAIAVGDAATAQAALAEHVRADSDAAGEFHAARKVLSGPSAVTRLFIGLAQKRGMPERVEARVINGLPGVIAEWRRSPPGLAPRTVMTCEIDESGQITALHSILATSKLAAMKF